MSIAWSYIRRILIAPFIALIVVYILPFNKSDGVNLTNEISIFFFSFIAGFFTKAVEEWVYEGVKKFLPDASKEEFKSRNEKYGVEKSDFVTKLGLPEDLAYLLYNAKIRTIEELARCNAEEIIDKVNLDTRNLGEGMGCPVKERGERLGDHSINQIRLAIEKAQEYLGIGKSKFVKVLGMKEDLASKLYNFANIRTIEDLSSRNEEYIYNRLSICKQEANKKTIKEHIDTAIEYMAIDKSEFVTKLNMDKGLAFKLSHFANIKTIEELKMSTLNNVHAKICDYKEESKEVHDRLCECSEEIIQKFINKEDPKKAQ